MQQQLIAPRGGRVPLPTNRTQQRPIAIELIGPAGSGKTTLREVLCRQDGFVAARMPSTAECLRCLPGSTFAQLSSYLARRSAGRWFNWEEIRSMVYLRAWLKSVRRRSAGDEVTVFDQGPVYRLAVLSEFGPGMVRGRAFRKWWGSALQAWKETLDLIVWLDAPNDVLLRRVRRRNKAHTCKSMCREEACNLLDRYRGTYRQTVAAMGRGGGPATLRLATNERTPHDIAEAVRAAVASATGGPGKFSEPEERPR